MKSYLLSIMLSTFMSQCLLSLPFTNKVKSTCEFALIIPSFNNEKYYKENLDSACSQLSTNPYHIYYINDCSTDATGTLVEAYIKEHHLEDKVTLIHNNVNIGGGANIYHTIHSYVEDHKIVVNLDGDDLLPHNNVLLVLEKYYENPDTWMTHGVLQTFPSIEKIGWDTSAESFKNNTLRKDAWGTHLRTFKAGLYKKIRKEDFLYKGEFMKVTWDLAFMLPMFEMCNSKGNGSKHCIFIPEVLYLYRINSPLNDFRIRGEAQREVERYIRSLPPYEALDLLV